MHKTEYRNCLDVFIVIILHALLQMTLSCIQAQNASHRFICPSFASNSLLILRK
jgi:hypothetical protein